MENTKCFLNFSLTLENYNNLLKYAKENDVIDGENMRYLSIFETFLFELSIGEIVKLQTVIKEQHVQYMKLLKEVEEARDMMTRLMNELTRLIKEKTEHRVNEELRKDKLQKEEESKKKSSFIKDLRDKFSKLFE